MPYIDSFGRAALRDVAEAIDGVSIKSVGDLNYLLTKITQRYLDTRKDLRGQYQTFNDVIGALECAKMELYRRQVAAYEDEKCAENGDVYTPADKRRARQRFGLPEAG